MEAPDFYFDAVAQVRMGSWSRGRAVLLGDAWYCSSPLSGQGTGLALTGGYVLAAELEAADGDHVGAFARYEERMRPFVEASQELAMTDPGGEDSQARVDAAKNALALDG